MGGKKTRAGGWKKLSLTHPKYCILVYLWANFLMTPYGFLPSRIVQSKSFFYLMIFTYKSFNTSFKKLANKKIFDFFFFSSAVSTK